MIYDSTYESIRPRLATGDVVFFGGRNGFYSRLIRWWTRSPYSHAAIVLRNANCRVELMESTTLLNRSGVQRTYLSDRIDRYDGIVDVATLSTSVRFNFSTIGCEQALLDVENRPYDTWGAALSGLGQYLRIPGRQRANALFCSELVDYGHVGGLLTVGKDRTPTPEELARRPIYGAFYRVKGAA